MDVEANMRIPGLSLKTPGAEPQVINNSSNRYTRMITVNAVPKVGEPLAVPVGEDLIFDCVVTRAEWSDDREIFVVSCTYAKRSITPHEYQSLINDSSWTLKQLP